MTLLNIFHTGGLTTVLTLIWLGLTGWFGYQTVKAYNSGGIQQGSINSGPIEDNLKTPLVKIPQFWFAVVTTILYIIALIKIASDYKGV